MLRKIYGWIEEAFLLEIYSLRLHKGAYDRGGSFWKYIFYSCIEEDRIGGSFWKYIFMVA